MRNLPPFIKILPLAIVGIMLGQMVAIGAWWVAVAALVCTALGYSLRRRWVGEVYIGLSVVLWALCATEIRTPQHIPQPTSPSELDITITTEPYTVGRWQRCDASTIIGGHEEKILLRADTSLSVALGERGVARGFLNPLPEGAYGSLMSRRGYIGTLYLTSPHNWYPTDTLYNTTIISRKIQRTLLARIDRLGLEPDESGVVKAMLLGWRGGITPSLRNAYSRSGSSHILAISGLHVGIVAMVVWWLCWLLPIMGRKGHLVRNIIASVVMVCYAIICGLSPSVVRATTMFVVAQMALCYGTSRSVVNILAGAATVMLLVNPNNLFDISFQLSFVAVVGIVVGMPSATDYFGEQRGGNLLWRTLLGIVLVGLCSTIATLPLVAHTFSVVSLVGIFINPIVILTAEIIVVGGLIWVSLPLEWLHKPFEWIVGGAARLQNRVVEYAAGLDWAALECDIPLWITLVAYGLMLAGIALAAAWREKKRWKMES